MIAVAEDVWVGGSESPHLAEEVGAKSLLCVAIDIMPEVGWPDIEAWHVGLLDGPGNTVRAYSAAVMALAVLTERGAVVVYDHSGSRAVTVAAMFLNMREGKRRLRPTEWSHWLSLTERLQVMRQFADQSLPVPHQAHWKAFDKMPFGLLEAIQ